MKASDRDLISYSLLAITEAKANKFFFFFFQQLNDNGQKYPHRDNFNVQHTNKNNIVKKKKRYVWSRFCSQ